MTLVIHNLITVEVDDRFPWREACLNAIGDVSLLADTGAPVSGVCLRLTYESTLSPRGMWRLADRVYGSSDSLLDLRYGVRLRAQDDKVLVLSASRPCLEWFEWALQLTFLAAGTTQVHAAAVERGAQAILFASGGGVGKTSLAAGLVREMGYRLLGDDAAVLSAQGLVYAFPKAMVLYPYHRGVFPDVFSRGRGPIAPARLNRSLTRVAAASKLLLRPFPGLLQFARRHNPQSVRIRPSEVFGADKIARQARLETVVWLERVKGDDEPRLRAADATLPSRIMGSTISQYDPHCVALTHVAMGLGIVDCERLYGAWLRALTHGLRGCRGYFLSLPQSLPPTRILPAVRDALAQHGVVKG